MKTLQIQVVLLMLAGHLLAADYAVLRNGFNLKHERREVNGDTTRLYLNASHDSGYVEVKTAEIVRIERDDTAPAAPAASGPPAPPTAADLDALIQQAATRHNLSPEFIRSVIKTESGFRTNAVSPKGAQGLMQLMPRTAASLDVKDSLAPDQNVEGGVRYLRQLLEQYDYDPVKALAAYNAGSGNVDRYHGVPPFRETRAYVSRIARDFDRRTSSQATHPAPSKSMTPAKPRQQ
jgi:soluble lytic murein transglycosylase-like protein